ncbi:MAG TPA: ribonuclease R, partial [Bacteroidota bacterium]|nr:ribonuclease R [Bacteroidota bacterium]
RGKFTYVRRKEKKNEGKKNRGGGPESGHIRGTLFMTRRGFGFVAIEGTDDEIYIAPRYLHTALHSDVVEVVRFAGRPGRAGRSKGREDDRPEGEVVAILERKITTVTGRLESGRSAFFVVPDDERIARDIYVSREDSLSARPGDKVVVRLLEWTDEHQNPEGVITEVLGTAGDARVEVLSVARTFGLPEHFPPDVEREAAACSAEISRAEIDGRIDCRAITTVTIDPEDAKDFDDAVSYEPLRGGGWRLGVHIADVSHYVRPGTALDREAYARGTSVYMVNEVVPMLPERLSNDLCSLKPDVDRLTYSVFMDVDPAGTVTDYRIGKSVIHSARRFTYEEVQRVIDTGKGDHAAVILPLFQLSKVLLRRRRKNGSLDFDTGEAKFQFDAEGLPSRIIKKIRLDAHRLIEECMLLANQTVARHIGARKKEAEVRPFVYRVHDLPDPVKLRELAGFVRQFGYSLDAKNGVSSRELQKLLDRVDGSEVENVINEVALRSMAKAVYATKNIGHYGLAFSHYTHFTSPIRRYPDLIVHRLLEEYDGPVRGGRLEELRKTLPDVARQSSERERLAAEAERASVKVMQVEYMKRHVGDEFAGVITGVTNFGLFVEINDLLVEGMIPLKDLTDDYYIFDEKKYSIRGRSRGKVYRLGDPLRVQVISVDPGSRRIDFQIAG